MLRSYKNIPVGPKQRLPSCSDWSGTREAELDTPSAFMMLLCDLSPRKTKTTCRLYGIRRSGRLSPDQNRHVNPSCSSPPPLTVPVFTSCFHSHHLHRSSVLEENILLWYFLPETIDSSHFLWPPQKPSFSDTFSAAPKILMHLNFGLFLDRFSKKSILKFAEHICSILNLF